MNTMGRAFVRGPLRLISRLLARTAQWAKRTMVPRTRVGRMLIDAMFLPHDLERILVLHREAVGRRPRLLRPHAFTDKIQARKIFDRRPELTARCDKLRVRDFVKSRVGERYLAELLWEGVDIRDARALALHDPCVIKSNHGSGQVKVVRDPAQVDWHSLHATTQEWLAQDFSEIRAEWQYRWVPRRLLVEAFIGDRADVTMEHKFWCFHGRVRFFTTEYDLLTPARSKSWRDRDGLRLPWTIEGTAEFDGPLQKPECLAEMIWLSEELAADEPFVRVDLYPGSPPMFGELTYTPRAGLQRFVPERLNEQIGAMW